MFSKCKYFYNKPHLENSSWESLISLVELSSLLCKEGNKGGQNGEQRKTSDRNARQMFPTKESIKGNAPG